MNEKALIELRNAKVSEMRNVVAKAKAEGRALTDEEKTTFNNLEKEIKNIDETIEINNKVAANYLQKAPEPGAPTKGEQAIEDEAEAKKKLYAKERKEFANTLRRFVNATDTPTTKTDATVMIPTTVWDHIITKVEDICPIYQWSDKFDLKGNFVIPVDNDEGNLAVDWAEEFDELVSGNVRLASIELKGYLAGVLAKISKSLINNTNFDIVGFVEAKIARKIAKFIEKQLLYGTEGKATGLSTIAADMTIETAAANAIRELKDREGDYMLNRDFTTKWGYTLLGKEVYTSKQMKEIAAGNVVIYYGDFSGLATKTVEAGQIQPLYEKFATQHALGLVAYIEFDAKIADKEKIAQLKMKAA